MGSRISRIVSTPDSSTTANHCRAKEKEYEEIMIIKVPQSVWTLGDPEYTKRKGLVVWTRPIYYRPEGKDSLVRVGEIDPDYAGYLMEVLGEVSR
jgi:hypothetical protein